MTVWRLVIKEIGHRKLNFGLGLLSVTIAVGCLVATLTLLRGHDIRTEQFLARKQAETQRRMKKLEDDYRKITKNLGFNILILPKDQNLAEFYSDDFASKLMPESYVDKLANSRIVTINHLLPSLTQKLRWPETQRTIILIGVRGEVPLLHRDPKKPLLDPVPQGTAILGYELHRSLRLKKGDKIKLLGDEFTVSQCYPERGSKDDITVWIDLAKAQALLDKRGKINAILALECLCAVDRLPKIRAEIAKILPETRVIEKGTKATVRAEARQRAKQEALAALAAEKTARAHLRQEIEGFAAVLIPLVVAGCALWIGLLAWGNVRERRAEIGILRALGLRSRQILLAFLTRAIVIGLLGAGIGYAAGLAAGMTWSKILAEDPSYGSLFLPGELLLVLALAPVLSGLASWIPAVLAAQQDPARILSQE